MSKSTLSLFLGERSAKKQDETLRQIRCHVNDVTKSMVNTIEVSNDEAGASDTPKPKNKTLREDIKVSWRFTY